MGMSGDNKNLIVTILAIIGGIVVLGWVLKIAIIIALVVGGVMLIQNKFGGKLLK